MGVEGTEELPEADVDGRVGEESPGVCEREEESEGAWCGVEGREALEEALEDTLEEAEREWNRLTGLSGVAYALALALALDVDEYEELAEYVDWEDEYGVGEVDGGVGSCAWGVEGGRASALAPRLAARDLSWAISVRREWHSWDLAVSWACCENGRQ